MNRVFPIVFLSSLPFIDLLTSLTRVMHFPISFGMIIRGIILVFLFFYLYRYYLSLDRFLFTLFLGSFSVFLISFLINLLYKNNFSTMEELNLIIKSAYFTITMFLIIYFFKVNNFMLNPSKIVNFVSFIVGISFWLAILTNTGFKSYSYNNFGFSGWFLSANEVSIIVLILLALLLVYMKDGFDLSWINLFLILSIITLLGTKTAYIGGLGILLFYISIQIVFYKKQIPSHKKNYYVIGVTILFLLSQALVNKPKIMHKPQQNFIINPLENTDSSFLNLLNQILSSRLLYLENTWTDYKIAIFLRKLFGLGYAGDVNSRGKTIEMDFFDLFFSYGLIGSIVLLMPIIYLLFLSVKLHFTQETSLLLFTLILCLGISFTAGHLVFAPSVLSYILLLFISIIHLNFLAGDVCET